MSDKDCLVIAINPREIPFEHADTDPPRILQAGYTVGSPYLVVDSRDGQGQRVRLSLSRPRRESTKDRCERRARKRCDASPTGVFQQPEYNGLSALLCSRVDAANRPAEMGDDFQLAPNPHAQSAIASRASGSESVYYDAKPVKDGYDVTPIRARSP